ncbi:MAG: radical SAM protein [Candidatus Gracilibacteria bacterium]|nr:radical SAM protein [Candidatus Gracilibacteria bacterium]
MQYKIFGCKVNKYYTDEWLNSEYLRDKEGVFIASCVVTDQAKRKWIKFVKDVSKELEQDYLNFGINEGRLSESQFDNQIGPISEGINLKNLNNHSPKIFISGCGAFKRGDAQEDFFEIYPDLKYLEGKIEILGEKPEELKKDIIDSKEEKKHKAYNKLDLNEKFKNIPQIYTKKFLLIQGGCDSFCTFCLTVKKRGGHYYRDKDDIVEEILEFEVSGGKEVVLTGINLSAWGLADTNQVGKSRFAELIEYILEKTTIPRIRISSMGPEFIDDRCLELFKNTRIYPHFHYSVQSGSSNILKSMHRHYDGEYMKKLLINTKNLKREDNVEISIGADLIVGFPGETENDFLETYNLVADGLITKIHAFPFSAHNLGESVPAGIFPNQIDDKTKKERMWKLEAIGDNIRDEFIERNIGKEFRVLIEVVKEENGKIKWKGWTENYIEADQNTFEIIEGKIERNNIVVGILK